MFFCLGVTQGSGYPLQSFIFVRKNKNKRIFTAIPNAKEKPLITPKNRSLNVV